MAKVSVGVPAYNEEDNIRRCLEAILAQDMGGHELLEVIVVSSGSTDATDAIVSAMAAEDPRVRLLRQEERRGKASANNLFMASAGGDVLIQLNADALVSEGAFAHLLRPLEDPEVGVAVGRLASVNDVEGLFGFSAHLMFYLHHRVSSAAPKMCELFAIRNIGVRMPEDINTDEDWIGHHFLGEGYRIVYVPEAVSNLKGATNLRDFLHQRARVNIGENYMRRKYKYQPSTKDDRLVATAALDFIREERPWPHLLFGAVMLEMLARAYALVYVSMGLEDQAVWERIDSTKRH